MEEDGESMDDHLGLIYVMSDRDSVNVQLSTLVWKSSPLMRPVRRVD